MPWANIPFAPGFYPNPLPEVTVVGLMNGAVALECG